MNKAVICLAGAGLLAAACAGPQAKEDNAAKGQTQPAVVYFTKDISPEGLVKIYDKISQNVQGKVAIKVHTGEPHGPNIIPPYNGKGAPAAYSQQQLGGNQHLV